MSWYPQSSVEEDGPDRCLGVLYRSLDRVSAEERSDRVGLREIFIHLASACEVHARRASWAGVWYPPAPRRSGEDIEAEHWREVAVSKEFYRAACLVGDELQRCGSLPTMGEVLVEVDKYWDHQGAAKGVSNE